MYRKLIGDEAVMDMFLGEIAKLREEPVDAGELEKAKRSLEVALINSLDPMTDLAELLHQRLAAEPAVMIGHSIGDYVAACVAGVFSLADGLTLIADRARLVQGLPPDGKMAVVLASRDQVEDLVSERIASVAALSGSLQLDKPA